jgi:adenine deaminase
MFSTDEQDIDDIKLGFLDDRIRSNIHGVPTMEAIRMASNPPPIGKPEI